MRISVEEYSLSLFISLDTVFLNIVVVGFENNFKLTKKLQKQEYKEYLYTLYSDLSVVNILLHFLSFAASLFFVLYYQYYHDPLTQYHFSKYFTVYFLRIFSFISIVQSSTLINLALVQ